MPPLLIATTNPDKLREIRDVLAGVEVIGLGDLPPVDEPDETGDSFEDNARLKAFYYDGRYAAAPDIIGREATLTVAEDSGFVIDAMNGEPGVRSARFLRADASYADRFTEIDRRMRERPNAPRTARFVCALAVVRHGVLVFETTATVEGEVAERPRGSGGFGYDPIFYYPPYGCTLAEVSQADKLRVAHRGQAFRRLATWLRATVDTTPKA